MGTTIRNLSITCALMLALIQQRVYAQPANSTSETSEANPAYTQLQKQVDRFYEIEKNGGWPLIKGSKKFYIKGQTDPAVKQIKERLRVTGEFTAADSSALFTEELVSAVQKVQKQFGFKENGVVDQLLIKQLNVPVESRIQQLQVNMERMLAMPYNTEGTRLVANIPEYKLHVYEGDHEVFDMDVVVGSESHQTVTFSDEMTHIVFSPYWNVPESIVANEFVGKSSSYLARNGYEVTGYQNGLPVIRQKPGPQNSLGQVKFVFPNEHNIYFHDTPAKGLFDYSKRTFSHGCIRLAEPAKLAEYLLRNSKEWTPEKIAEAMNSGREQTVKLDAAIPVSLTYITAWVGEDGQLNLRQDVYGLDKKEGYKVAAK
jgi:murein L,D-transpeptidase YcbB/YkuD